MSYGDIEIVQTVQIVHIFIQYRIKETGEVNQYNLEIKPTDNPDLIR